MPKFDEEVVRRVTEALLRGEEPTLIGARECLSKRDIWAIEREAGITIEQLEDARYGASRRRKAMLHGLVLAGMSRRAVEREYGTELQEITACWKPRWWGPRYDAIAEEWRKWALENVPPEELRSGRPGRRQTSDAPICCALDDDEAIEMARQIAGGMKMADAGRLHGVCSQTARRVFVRARERGLA